LFKLQAGLQKIGQAVSDPTTNHMIIMKVQKRATSGMVGHKQQILEHYVVEDVKMM
jgi:hypothetical protein